VYVTGAQGDSVETKNLLQQFKAKVEQVLVRGQTVKLMKQHATINNITITFVQS